MPNHSIAPDTRPHFSRLLELCRPLAPLRTAVICPDEKTALEGALDARDENLITPILIGNRIAIEKTASDNDYDISGLDIIEADEKRPPLMRVLIA